MAEVVNALSPIVIRPWPLSLEWGVVDWLDVHARFGWAPHDLPGVQALPHGGSVSRPFPYLVHRSHLPLFGGGSGLPVVNALRGREFVVTPNPLRDYQVEDVGFIRSRRGTLHAGEQRTGKTPAALYSHDPGEGLCVVAGPVAARAVWASWTERRFGPGAFLAALKQDFKAETVTAAGAGLRVLFMSLALMPYWDQLFQHVTIGTLIIDEAHLAGVQNRNSLTVEAWRKLCTVSQRVIACTGTPLYNKPKGLWPILNLIAPAAFGDWRAFGLRYCGAVMTQYGHTYEGASNQDELAKRLGEVMIRRTWQDIRPGLPPIQRVTETAELNAKEMEESIKLGATKTLGGETLARLRILFGKAKVRAVVPCVKQIIAAGHKVIVWAYHREVIEALRERLAADVPVFGPIHGAMAGATRETVIAQAKQCGSPCALLATMGSLATAVDLSFCTHAVFSELDWTPTTIAQAEMRPFDGVNAVCSIYFVADCDTDRRLADALLRKLENSKALGLKSGVGDVAELLRAAFPLAPEGSLSNLAEQLCADAEAYY